MFCGARAKSTGRPCRAQAVRGRKRCRVHGGHSGGWRWDGLHDARAAWIARLHAAGLKAPGGYPKGIPRRKDRIVAKAKQIIVQAKADRAGGNGGLAGTLERVVAKGLDRAEEFLDAVDPEKPLELLTRQAELGMQLIRTQVRLDDATLRHQSDDRFLAILERLNERALPAPTDEDEEATSGASA